jgi:hypothetical protein
MQVAICSGRLSFTRASQSGQAAVKNTRFGLLFHEGWWVTDLCSSRRKGQRVLVCESADGAQRRRPESHERSDGEHAPRAHVLWHSHGHVRVLQELVSTIKRFPREMIPDAAFRPSCYIFVESTGSRRVRWRLMGSHSKCSPHRWPRHSARKLPLLAHA